MVTLVTGGTGFVGSNIVRTLAEKGHDVVSLDISPPDSMVLKYLQPWSSNTQFVELDILNAQSLHDVGSRYSVDKIVHAAVYTSTLEETERDDSRRIIDVNIGCTANMLELARTLNIKRFVYVSSGGVYRGLVGSVQPLTEDLPLSPTTFYNITKYASEGITQRYGEVHNFEAVCVRLSSPYGPMERPTNYRVLMGMLYNWTRSIVRNEPIHVPLGTMGGDWMFVRDKAEAICTVLDAEALNHKVYNITQGAPASLSQIIEAFKQADPSARFVGPGIQEDKTETARSYMDISNLKELGFTPKHDLISGVKEYINWRQEFPYVD